MNSLSHFELLVIGASAGGVSAVQTILKGLSADMRLPIVVVQHVARGIRTDLNYIYATSDKRRVCEAEDKMPIQPSGVYFATPDYHLMIERDRSFSLSQDQLVNYSRPSIDVTFESAAKRIGNKTIAILLTGANQDGAAGLQKVHLAGGLTIVQDPAEAECPTMPEAALRLFNPSKVMRLSQIADFLNQKAECRNERSSKQEQL